jgi:hypothetical protein
VSCRDHFVVRVLRPRGSYGTNNTDFGFEPGLPEADGGRAGIADCGGCDGEVQVREPVADRARSAEGDDDEFVGCVRCYEAGYVGLD